jgi:hypothetical protein
LQKEQRTHDERIHAQKVFSSDAAALESARKEAERRAVLLDSCVDWHIVEDATAGEQMHLRFGKRYQIDIKLSANLAAVEAMNLSVLDGEDSEWRRAAVHLAGLHELLEQSNGTKKLSMILTEASHRLGRIQGLQNELKRLQGSAFIECLIEYFTKSVSIIFF